MTPSFPPVRISDPRRIWVRRAALAAFLAGWLGGAVHKLFDAHDGHAEAHEGLRWECAGCDSDQHEHSASQHDPLTCRTCASAALALDTPDSYGFAHLHETLALPPVAASVVSLLSYTPPLRGPPSV
jgi:hypothetical protein